ncbi:hypothetical protein BD560DRAFT_436311 [Blakeslea trispora]|nr:hypothetical protein BD560DRAFT_436311 [Blakeslea trispora]
MSNKHLDQKIDPSHYVVIRWLGLDQLAPEQMVTSHWVSTRVFFVIRLLNAIYSTIVFWIYFAIMAKTGQLNTIFAAFTTLNFIGLHAYLVTATVHHARYLYTKKIDFWLNQPAILNYLYVFLYSTVATFNIIVVVIFWSMLVDANGAAIFALLGPLINWINLSVHGISLLMIMIDVLLVRFRTNARMVLPVFLIFIMYILLTFIIYATTEHWEYPFLDWSQGPIAALWYFVNLAVCIASFFVVMLIEYIRDQLASFLP